MQFRFCLIFLSVISFWYNLTMVQTETPPTEQDISLVIIHENEQTDVPATIANVLKKLEDQNTISKHKFIDNYIHLDRKDYKNMQQNLQDQLCPILERGVTIVIDVTWAEYNYVKYAANQLEIPYFRIDLSIQTFWKMMEYYLMERSANDAALIFQNQIDADSVLYYIIQNSNLRIIVFDDLNEKTIDRIKSIRPYPSYYTILADNEHMNNLFDSVLRSNLIKKPDKWNLMFLDFKSDQFKWNASDEGVHRLMQKIDVCCAYQEQPMPCSCANDFSIQNSMLEKFIKIVTANIINSNLQLVKDENCKSIKEKTFNSSDLRENEFTLNILEQLKDDQNIFSIDDNANTGSMQIRYHTEFRVSATRNTIKSTLDMETEELDILAVLNNDNITILNAEYDMQSKRLFRIGITEAVPWSYMLRDEKTGELILDENGVPIWVGYCIDLIAELARNMNFDYEYVVPRQGDFGKRLEHDKWDGIVGDLIVGDTDMAVAPLKMTAEREEVIDFVAPYFEQTGILIVMRNPVRETSLFKFMTVLKLEVWLSIVAALIATAVMIWFLDKYSPYSAKNYKEAYPYPCRDFTLKESFWFALTSFTPQGGGEAPKAISGRTLVAAYWLFVVLMLATFTANLAAFLTVERMQTPVQSLDQLARQSRIQYTVVNNSDTHHYFLNMKNAEDTLYRVWKEITLNSTSDQSQYRVWDYPIKEQYGQILSAIQSASPMEDAKTGFKRVNEELNADFAFIHDSAEIKYEISRNCNLTEVGEVFAEQPYSIAVQQGSHLQDEISHYILELQKDRFFEMLTAKFWNNSVKGVCPNTDDSEGITLESLGGVFIATLFGLALAMVTLIAEIGYYRRKKAKSNWAKVKPLVTNVIMRPASNETKIKQIEYSPSDEKKNPRQVTIGSNFVPASENRPRVSYISVFPRNPIHD